MGTWKFKKTKQLKNIQHAHTHTHTPAGSKQGTKLVPVTNCDILVDLILPGANLDSKVRDCGDNTILGYVYPLLSISR